MQASWPPAGPYVRYSAGTLPNLARGSRRRIYTPSPTRGEGPLHLFPDAPPSGPSPLLCTDAISICVVPSPPSPLPFQPPPSPPSPPSSPTSPTVPTRHRCSRRRRVRHCRPSPPPGPPPPLLRRTGLPLRRPGAPGASSRRAEAGPGAGDAGLRVSSPGAGAGGRPGRRSPPRQDVWRSRGVTEEGVTGRPSAAGATRAAAGVTWHAQ